MCHSIQLYESFTSCRYDPNWIVHTRDILVRSLAEPWEFTLYDHHHCIPDGVIGSASFDPTSVQDALSFSQADLCIPMTKDGKETAEALVSIAYHPVLEQEKETGMPSHDAMHIHSSFFFTL